MYNKIQFDLIISDFKRSVQKHSGILRVEPRKQSALGADNKGMHCLHRSINNFKSN